MEKEVKKVVGNREVSGAHEKEEIRLRLRIKQNDLLKLFRNMETTNRLVVFDMVVDTRLLEFDLEVWKKSFPDEIVENERQIIRKHPYNNKIAFDVRISAYKLKRLLEKYIKAQDEKLRKIAKENLEKLMSVETTGLLNIQYLFDDVLDWYLKKRRRSAELSNCQKGLVPYPGNKETTFRDMQWLFPEDCSMIYVEPFAGSMANLFLGERYAVEIANDINPKIINMFKMIQIKPLDIMEILDGWEYSFQRYKILESQFKKEKTMGRTLLEKSIYEAARMFYLLYNSINGIIGRFKGEAQVAKYSEEYKKQIAELPAFSRRLKGVELTCTNYGSVIRKFLDNPHVFFMVDPPYLKTDSIYKQCGIKNKKGKNIFPEEEHRKLANLLIKTKGKWLVTHDYNQIIHKLYMDKNCFCLYIKVPGGRNKEKLLCIYTNYDVSELAAVAYMEGNKKILQITKHNKHNEIIPIKCEVETEANENIVLDFIRSSIIKPKTNTSLIKRRSKD